MSVLENHPSSPPELKVINGYHNTKTQSTEGSKSLSRSKSSEMRISESDLAKVGDVANEKESLGEEEKGCLMEKEGGQGGIREETNRRQEGTVSVEKRNKSEEGRAVRGLGLLFQFCCLIWG